MEKFLVKKGKDGIFFNLKAANGQVIGVSETYETDKACLKGIGSVQKYAQVAAIEDQTVEGFKKVTNPKFEVYKDNAGEYRFRLKAKNGHIILSSEGYKIKASAMNGIASVVKNSSSDTVTPK